jgi:predicted permease
MAFVTIFQQILVLAIIAVIGVLSVRFKILNNDAKNAIEKIVFFITLPLLIITKLASLEITGQILKNGFQVIVFTYVILVFQIVIGKVSSRWFNLNPSQKTIHLMHTFLGNIVFLGFPLLDALYPGGEAILYAALYQLVMNTVLWTYGIQQLNPAKEKGLFQSLKKLFNPNTIALLIGLSLMILKLKLPGVLDVSLGGVGKATLPLAMIYIGILLATTKLKETVKKWDVLFLSINKLVIIPVLLIILLKAILSYTPFQLNGIAVAVLILEAAMPCMTILVILAKRYGADDQKAMENFFISTVLSVLTLPFIIFLIEKVFV